MNAEHIDRALDFLALPFSRYPLSHSYKIIVNTTGRIALIVLTEPGVFELLKTKFDATSATMVVSTGIYNFSSRQFGSGTGFALNRLSVCFFKTHAANNRANGNR